jgi:DNA uptake protein ComE-like DNA-binding protein
MNLRADSPEWLAARSRRLCQRGSTFVIVLWIAVGLVSVTLYFSDAMRLELRAADNRVSGMAAEQAIEGAARYVAYMLSMRETNGVLPDPNTYLVEAAPVGAARFWLIGRETNTLASPNQIGFGLVDEASKLNLNTATSNMLVYLPYMNVDLTVAILDWRDTNGGSGAFATYYAMAAKSYENKSAEFETVDELRLLYGGDLYALEGEDANRNGVLDPNEYDENHNGVVDPGVLEYVTIYSREPNTYSNGVARVSLRNVGATGALADLLSSTFGSSKADQILGQLGLVSMGGGGGPGRQQLTTTRTFASPLAFYRASGMTVDEFGQIANALTTATGSYINGRINVNTAPAAVLACLPGISDNPGLEQTLVDYRTQNPANLTSVAWLVEALGQNNASVLEAMAASDCLTTESYQFTADIAAVGPERRGYRRVRFVFDTCDGTPRIVHRQDLTHLGWALGKDLRRDKTDQAPGATARRSLNHFGT